MTGKFYDYDVIVVGAGNTALLTALRAHEFGVKVLVLEIAPKEKRGGNAYYTTGIYRIVHNGLEDIIDLIPDLTEEERNIIISPYTADDYFREYSKVTEGMVDPSLMEMVVERSTDAIRWMVKKQNVKMELTSNFVHRIDGKLHFLGEVPISAKGAGAGLSDYLFDRVEKMEGIDLLYETGARQLLLDEKGNVCGVKAKSKEGLRDIYARAVCLSCGGFEANPAWRARYLGPTWDLAKVRGGKYNMGDGLKMALDMGAQPYGHWSCCHATFIDADAPQPSIKEDTDTTAKRLFIFGLIFNVNGERFLDEGEDHMDLTYARFGKTLLTQPDRMGFQLFDSKGYATITQGHVFHDYVHAPYTKASNLGEMAEKLGMNPEKFTKTVEQYNMSIKPGGKTNLYKIANASEDLHAEGIFPAKSSCAFPLDTPPYYAFPVCCGITFTYGGLKVNRQAQVVDINENPISGLYASGEIIGGLFYHNYPGATGQLTGAVFAHIAGKRAAEYSKRFK